MEYTAPESGVIIDKLRAMHTFVAIAEAGSLTAAARRHRMSLPTVVRTLAGLEAELRVRLFNRTTRQIALTEEGRRYLASCRAILALVAEAEADLDLAATEPTGSLVITAPVLFGQLHVAPLVVRFVRDHPQMRCDLQLQDRVVDLVEEGIDVGVQIGHLPDSGLVAYPVGSVRRMVVASPAHLQAVGTPAHPRDLARLNCLRFTGASGPWWTFQEGHRALDVAINGNLGFNHVAPAVQACIAGAGFGCFISYQVAEALAAGTLVVVLAEFERPPRPVQVVVPHRARLPLRTRAFVAAARAALRAALAESAPAAPSG